MMRLNTSRSDDLGNSRQKDENEEEAGMKYPFGFKICAPRGYEMLSKLVDNEIKRVRKKRILSKQLRNLIGDLYLPSIRTFVIVLLTTIGCVFIGKQVVNLFSLEGINVELVPIHAGIGSIIFALIIFVAESMRDDDSDKPRVLLKVSLLFPLAVVEIFMFFYLMWVKVTVIDTIFILIIGMLVIFSLGQVISSQLNKNTYSKMRVDLMKGRVKQSINLAIRERIGKNLLLKKLGHEGIRLQYSYPPEDGSHVLVTAARFGSIQNINLIRLDKFSRLLDQEAKRNGFSFSETQANEIRITDPQTQEAVSKKPQQNSRRYINKIFHDPVVEESRVLLSFEKTLVRDPNVVERLISIGRGAFDIRESKNFSQEIKLDLAGLKDQYAEAISRNAVGKIDELVSLYVGIAEGFLELLVEYGSAYSFDQAIKERQSLGAGWDEVRWLADDIRYLVKKTIESGDFEIINKTIHIPLAISRRAITKNDHYLFQEFIWFPELLYISANTAKTPELKDLLIDRSWRYLAELATYYLEFKLSSELASLEDLASLKNFAVYIYIRFQFLLKQSFDKRDIESFAKFLEQASLLFRYFVHDRDFPKSKSIQIQLEMPGLTAEQISELNEKLEKATNRESIQRELDDRRQQMLFGVSSWILFVLSGDKENPEVREFFELIRFKLNQDVKNFTSIFLEVHSFDAEDFWNWNNWESIPDGEIHSIDVLGKLEKLFVVQSLNILAGMDDEAILKTKLPFNQDLASLAQGTRTVLNLISDIEQNPKSWRYVLTSEAVQKTLQLRMLLQKASTDHAEAEEREKIAKPISPKKIKEFKKELISEFYKSADFRAIFSFYGLYEKPLKMSDTQFGISVVDDKASFFDSWYSHYLDWGKNYGRGMARGEDLQIAKELLRLCSSLEFEKFSEFVSSQKSEDLIIILINASVIKAFKNLENVTPEWSNDGARIEINPFAGWYNSERGSIPIFEIHSGELEGQILLIDIHKFGKLKQFIPHKVKDNPDLFEDVFFIDIKSFSEDPEFMSRFLASPPHWLINKVERVDQEAYLLGKVRIEIFESFQYFATHESIGFAFQLGSSARNH